MASRSPPRSPLPAGSRTAPKRRRRRAATSSRLEDIAACAARLGITAERVLEAYAQIAFADLRHFVEWGPTGFKIKDGENLSDADIGAVSEIVALGADGAKYRLKLYDKKAALDAIARQLGMFPPPRRRDGEAPADPAEDAREELARRLARLAAGGAAG